jgi:hypothetical protein
MIPIIQFFADGIRRVFDLMNSIQIVEGVSFFWLLAGMAVFSIVVLSLLPKINW